MLKTVAYLLIIFSIQIFVGCETTVIEPLQMRPSTIEIENKYRFLVPNQKIALVIEGDGDGKTTITSSNQSFPVIQQVPVCSLQVK